MNWEQFDEVKAKPKEIYPSPSHAVLPHSFMTFHMSEFVIRDGSKKAVVSQSLRHSLFEQLRCSILVVSQQLSYQIYSLHIEAGWLQQQVLQSQSRMWNSICSFFFF